MNYSNYLALLPLSHHPEAQPGDYLDLSVQDLVYIREKMPEFLDLAAPHMFIEYISDEFIIGDVCAATREIND